LLLALAVLASACIRARPRAPAAPPVQVGPARGTLVLAGGGEVSSIMAEVFVAAAGGPDARIVVIPTADEPDTFPRNWLGIAPFRRVGVRSIRILHTRDRGIADSEAFANPLQQATGVWITGGRQYRLADAYLGTRTEQELNRLLARGGVVGGTSAGASMQASYLLRGGRDANTIVMAPGYEQGFGFLRNTAVDQHLSARQRERDLLGVIEHYPQLLGIGLDEGTAIIVRGDTAQVIGRQRVAFYNTNAKNRQSWFWLKSGDRFDLNRRAVIRGTPMAGN
jgi:cyanophycinase